MSSVPLLYRVAVRRVGGLLNPRALLRLRRYVVGCALESGHVGDGVEEGSLPVGGHLGGVAAEAPEVIATLEDERGVVVIGRLQADHRDIGGQGLIGGAQENTDLVDGICVKLV